MSAFTVTNAIFISPPPSYLLLSSIFSPVTYNFSTKGLVAVSNANTAGDGSKAYRAYLYGCLIHVLEHTQGRGDAMVDGFPGHGDGGDGLVAASSGLASSPTLVRVCVC